MPSEESVREKLESIDAHAKEIEELSKQPLVKDETWYLIDSHWFKAWKRHVGLNRNLDEPSGSAATVHFDIGAHPGPIDNSGLFIQSSGEPSDDSLPELRENLTEEADFVLVPEEAWKKLKDRFGLKEDSHELGRKVIESGMFYTTPKVEIYMLELHIYLANYQEGSPNVVVLSRTDKFSKLLRSAKQLLKVPVDKPESYRIYIKHDKDRFERVTIHEPSKTLEDIFYPKQKVVFDVQTEVGLWHVDEDVIVKEESANISNGSAIPLPGPSSLEGSPGAQSDLGSSKLTLRSGHSYGTYNYGTSGNSMESIPGICGLQNLGNTCFMNSGIQCLSQVAALTDYFIRKQHETEINEDNPLGMHGRLAKAYAEVIHQMWGGNHSYVIPRGLKLVVGQFAPAFSGYHQQDSQELLSFLLDGLHEDLNRIRKKPYIETKESDGRDDAVVAAEAWDDYKKRNDSVIVDTFHGQLRSTLVCPVCSKVSIKFDPFCFLSLPLPVRKERPIVLTFVPLDPNKPWIKLKVNVPKQGTYGDIAVGVETMLGFSAENLLVAEVYQYRLHKIFRTEESLSGFMDRDEIVVYELKEIPEAERPIIVAVIQRFEKRLGSSTFHSSTRQTFACPVVFRMAEKDLTIENLRQEVIARLGTHIAEWPASGEIWWNEERDEEDSGVEENGDVGEKMDTSQSEEVSLETASTSAAEELTESRTESNGGTVNFFELCSVNHYGSTTYEEFKGATGSVVEKLRDRIDQGSVYLAADWSDLAYQKFYKADFAESFEQHDSVKAVRSRKLVDLSECIDLFTTTEKLGKDDLWYCPGCKEHQQASKKMDLWFLPEVMLIHLKRFSYTRWYRDKVDADVDFPTRGLDMNRWLLNRTHGPAVYDLLAVSNHYGGLGGGHYTAYGLNRNGKWYDFDDSSVHPISEDSVVTRGAYVLLYVKRKNVDPSVDRNIEMETSEGEEE